MKINTKDKIKKLDGTDTDLTVGVALSNILLGSKAGGKMKMFELARKCYKDGSVEIDTSDKALIKQAIEADEQYNNLVAGPLLEMLENLKEEK